MLQWKGTRRHVPTTIEYNLVHLFFEEKNSNFRSVCYIWPGWEDTFHCQTQHTYPERNGSNNIGARCVELRHRVFICLRDRFQTRYDAPICCVGLIKIIYIDMNICILVFVCYTYIRSLFCLSNNYTLPSLAPSIVYERLSECTTWMIWCVFV